LGVIAIDGTKIKASASRDQNRSYHGIVAEILEEAERIDREEDELHGDARGDELPERFRSRESRRQALAEAKQRLDEKKAAAEHDASAVVERAVELDLERLGQHAEGRRGWLRNGRRQLDEQRERDARVVARSRSERLADAKRRLEEQLAVEVAANVAYGAYRARGVMSDGRRFGSGSVVGDITDTGLVYTAWQELAPPNQHLSASLSLASTQLSFLIEHVAGTDEAESQTDTGAKARAALIEELIAWSTDPRGIDRDALAHVNRDAWGTDD
jgi:hypothetical protein